MPFTSMIIRRTLSARLASLSKRVGRLKNRHRESVARFKAKNDLLRMAAPVQRVTGVLDNLAGRLVAV